MEKKLKEENELANKKLLEQREIQQKKILEQRIQERYVREMAKLPKVYKRTLVRNYKPLSPAIEHVNGYDINYISSIGEKIDGNRPIFLFSPELGTMNLHALSMALQSSNLGEINCALNSLLVTSADSNMVIPLNQYPNLLNAICIHGINIMRDLSKNSDNPKKLRERQTNKNASYCDEYDTESYLNRGTIAYNQNSQRVDAIFDMFTKNQPKEDSISVTVDSLTGIDVSQDDSVTSPATSASDSDPDLNDAIDMQLANMKKTHNHPKKWKYLPDRLCFSQISHLDDITIYLPSYIETLKKIKEEVDDPFTRVNTRDAENPQVLVIDQLSTISMILRNISFSDVNANVMCSSHLLKRYLSDLLWLVFVDNKKLLFERKLLNFKKDVMILLSNISHNLKLDSELDVMMLIMLGLSFGEPKKVKSEDEEDIITYFEYSVNWGKYQSFGVDIFAKLLSLNHPNRSFIQAVMLGKFNEERKSKNVEIVKSLLSKYNQDVPTKLLNDVVSFILSVIPFHQVTVQPGMIDEVAPTILQSLTALYEIVKLIDTGDSKRSSNYSDSSRNQTLHPRDLPIKWLTSFENVGINLRRLYGFFQNLIMQNENAPLIYKSISCRSVKLLSLLLSKACGNKVSCEKLIKIPHLLPSEAEFFTVLSNPIVDRDFVEEIRLFYQIRNQIYENI